LVGLIFMMGGGSHVFALICGALVLAASVFLLHSREMPLFAEQLAVPGLLAGTGLVAFGTAEMLHASRAGVDLALLIACLVAVPVRQAWVRTLLGAAIGVLGAASLWLRIDDWPGPMPAQLPWLAVACAWLLLHMAQRAFVLEAATARWIAGMEAVSAGMAAASLSGMIWASGHTFLLGAGLDAAIGGTASVGGIATMRGMSAALAIAGGAWLAWRWPVLLSWWYGAMVGLGALLAWFVPLLGVTLAILCVCVESRRYVLATYAGFAAAWMVGGLYYATAWPLAAKAQLLAGVGLALALLGRYAVAAPRLAPAPEPELVPERLPQAAPQILDKYRRAGFLLSGLLVLGIANAAIWQKESVIHSGAAVYVELAPVDPRSLMQGDYMRLSFRLPHPASHGAFGSTAQVVASVDERGVARLLRLRDGRALADGEFAIDLVRRHGAWTLVTDAWYFKEGEAQRWSKARYGEFRVAPDGKALLVGLRGPGLEKL
jgi:uncharacterized membrane-anchored protein